MYYYIDKSIESSNLDSVIAAFFSISFGRRNTPLKKNVNFLTINKVNYTTIGEKGMIEIVIFMCLCYS